MGDPAIPLVQLSGLSHGAPRCQASAPEVNPGLSPLALYGAPSGAGSGTAASARHGSIRALAQGVKVCHGGGGDSGGKTEDHGGVVRLTSIQ